MPPDVEAIAHMAAALLTAKMGEEELGRRGPIEPWQAVPTLETPALRRARAALDAIRRRARKVRINLA